MPNKQRDKKSPPRSRGRPKGTPNKTTALLKDALLIAAENAGGKEGMVGYLQVQAIENPAAFMSLLGKVLPLQVTGKDGEAIKMDHTVSPAEKLKTMVSQIEKRSREVGGPA